MSTLKPFDTSGVEEKLSWSRPERRDQAGSLVVFGGVSLKLKEVDTVFKSAKSYGVGSTYALVPESLAKVFKRDDQYLISVNFDGYYGLTDSGQKIVSEEFAQADALILTDIGKSSATEHKLALLIAKTFKPVILTDSSVSILLNYHSELINNPSITLVMNLQNLQRIIKSSNLKLEKPLLSSSSFNQKLDVLSNFSSLFKSKVVLIDEQHLVAVEQDSYISQQLDKGGLEFAACLTCWQIWSPKSTLLEQVFAANSKL